VFDVGVQFWTTVTIISDDQPASGLDGFTPDVNNDVYDIAVQSKAADPADSLKEEKIILVGDFTSVNATSMNRIARMTQTGELDDDFNPGLGANGYINSVKLAYELEELPGGIESQLLAKAVIGGGFTSFNGSFRKGIARLNYDGSVDESFDPGDGVDGEVLDLFVQLDNRVIVAGDFVGVDGVPRNSIARLNAHGSLDEGFDVGEGPDGPIYVVRTLPDGRVIIAGDFLFVGDVFSPSIAVILGTNGKLDPSFSTGNGVNGEVFTLDLDVDGSSLPFVPNITAIDGLNTSPTNRKSPAMITRPSGRVLTT
jgi:hypothetical protein